MLVLDTDHASELGMRSAAGIRLLQRLEATREDAAITAITVEEGMRGWLAEIRRHSDPARQMAAYDHLVRQVELFAAWTILPWDHEAVETFNRLRGQGARVGTQDLKIAAIALAHDARLLTRNAVDFAKVPGLHFENWLD
jgi:tRNA(fMet)-specific endonuclease VapC